MNKVRRFSKTRVGAGDSRVAVSSGTKPPGPATGRFSTARLPLSARLGTQVLATEGLGRSPKFPNLELLLWTAVS